ncbi:MAG: ABC transporter substrate binding protein [Victivallales bacterium]|nr:ABC transporter substrate binding protein [Victivallales bacterium]
MKKGAWVIGVLAAACGAYIYYASMGKLQEQNKFGPCLNNGKKWTLGYLQSGKLKRYNSSLRHFINHLAQLGWLKPVDWSKLPPDSPAVAAWRFLADNVQSDYLQINRKHFWCHDWNLTTRGKNRKALLAAFTRKEVDLMLAMGSWAGLDMADEAYRTPALALESSFSLAGVLGCSGKLPGHLYLPDYPEVLLRQMRLFRKITKFKTLGVVYIANPEGRHRAGLEQLRCLSRIEKFTLVEAQIPPDENMSQEELLRKYLEAHNKIASRIDAMWVTTTLVNYPDTAAKVLAPFFKYRIPTWYPHGQEGVAHGVVFGVVSKPCKRTAHHARAAAQILHGRPPASLAADMFIGNNLAINCAAAGKINFKIPKNLLAVAQKSYLEISTGEGR